MAEKKYYFLKLETDYFGTKEIKKLRRVAGGDTFTIIYLKMQLRSLENNGLLIYEGIEDDFPKELASDLNEKEEDVKMTLAFLQANNMIEQVNDYEFFLNRVPETITSETAAAKRMRLHRQRKEIEEKRNKVTPLLQPVTERYIDIDIEQDINKELDIDIDTTTKTNEKVVVEEVPYKEIVELYNKICISFNPVKQITAKRKGNINARYRESGNDIEVFKDIFNKMQSSKFLKNGWSSGGKADFDWVMRPTNFTKVLEGKYNSNQQQSKNKSSNPFLELLQEELEKEGNQ